MKKSMCIKPMSQSLYPYFLLPAFLVNSTVLNKQSVSEKSVFKSLEYISNL